MMCRGAVDMMSETGSQVSWDDFSDSRCVSPALSCDFDITDTSFADSSSSSMSPPVGYDVTMMSPEPLSTTSTSSIWARFNSGISRFTQDLGRPSSSAASIAVIPSIEVSSAGGLVVPPRDDFVEGTALRARFKPS